MNYSKEKSYPPLFLKFVLNSQLGFFLNELFIEFNLQQIDTTQKDNMIRKIYNGTPLGSIVFYYYLFLKPHYM